MIIVTLICLALSTVSCMDLEDVMYNQISCSSLDQVQEVFKTTLQSTLDEERERAFGGNTDDSQSEWPTTFIDKPLEEIPLLYDYIHHFQLETDIGGATLKLYRGDSWIDQLSRWCSANVLNDIQECIQVINALVQESTVKEEWVQDTRRKQKEVRETRAKCEIRKKRKQPSLSSQVAEMDVEKLAAMAMNNAQCASKEETKQLYTLLVHSLRHLKDDSTSNDNSNEIESLFYRLGMSSGSDKVTHHRYDMQYASLFEEYLALPHFRLLEIGLSTGKQPPPSLLLSFFL